MFETTLVHKLLAAAAGATFSLAVGVGVGAVPHPGDAKLSAASASATALEPTFDPAHTRQPSTSEPTTSTTSTTVAPATTTPPTTAAPKVTTPPTTKAARPATTVAPAPVAPPAAAPVTTVPAKAPRRTPSAAEVQGAINGLKQQVGGILLLISPTPAQIAQAGDQICTAFDNGQTFAQVKATGLSMIPATVAVSPATLDWAVRTAVSMYCPAYASKLV